MYSMEAYFDYPNVFNTSHEIYQRLRKWIAEGSFTAMKIKKDEELVGTPQ